MRRHWLNRFRARLRYRRFDEDVRRELEVHRAMTEDALASNGLAPAEARRRASRTMGNLTIAREDARHVWIGPWFDSVSQDLRYAIRALRRSPGFATAVLLTLGIGIGLNVSLFTVFNALALRAWDVRDPGSVVEAFARPVGNRRFTNAMPLAEFQYFRDRTQTLAGLVAWERGAARIYDTGGGAGFEHVQLYGVSANFFDVLGIDMAVGRGFRPDEDVWGAAAPVAIVSHGLWLRAFGGDPSLLGRAIRVGVDQVPVTVVGIARRGFAGLQSGPRIDLFVPQSLIDRIDQPPGEQNPVARRVSVAGRLTRGAARTQAEAELNTLDRQFRESLSLDGNGFVLTHTRPIGQPGRTDAFLPILATLGTASLLVLLLACANVGNLQLARGMARRHEIAVRLSLGASRRRVIRQLLTEAGCLSLAAAMLAFALSWILPGLVFRLGGEDGPAAAALVPDRMVLIFAIGLGAAACILFALAPAIGTTRMKNPMVVSTRSTIDRRGRRLRSVLLGAQITLSLTLLTGAGLLTRGLMHVYEVDLGFDAKGTAVGLVSLPDDVPAGPAREALWATVDAALRTSTIGPVGWTGPVPPLSDSRFMSSIRLPDEDESWNRSVYDRPLSPESFGILGMTFVSGSPYAERAGVRQAVVNETLARMLFHGETAVGRTVLAEVAVSGATHEPYTIVGVVRDSSYTTPAEIVPLFHWAPDRRRGSFMVFRTDRPDAAAEARALLRSVDPRLDIAFTPVMSNVERVVEERRFAAGLAWAIGALALGLAAIGVFGVFAYSVEERRREIGIRLALGARARDVVGGMLMLNRWSVGGGTAAGVLLSVGAGFVLRGYLFGLSPLDPVAHLAVVLILAFTALLACVVPARRAVRIDPAITLKVE